MSILDARFRWCLTGTPIHNTLDDLGALLSFLRIQPFENISVFRKYMSSPFRGLSPRNAGEFIDRFALLLDSFSLRRPLQILDLPQVAARIRYVRLSTEERRHYDAASRRLQKMLDDAVATGPQESEQRHFGMFQVQLQLRLLCNHGTFQRLPGRLAPKGDGQCYDDGGRDIRTVREEELIWLAGAELECAGCSLPLAGLSAAQSNRPNQFCSHVFCPECASAVSDTTASGSQDGRLECSICSTNPSLSTTDRKRKHEDADQPAYFNVSGISTKIQTLLEDLSMCPKDEKR